MPIDIRILADTADEAMNIMRDLVRAGTPAPVEPVPMTMPMPSGLQSALDAGKALDREPEPEPTPAPPPAPPKRGRPAKSPTPALADAAPAGDPLADAPKTNGHAAPLNGAKIGARDAAVDLSMALDLLRAVYERPGDAPSKVLALLPEFNVSKFSDIPLDQAFDLLTRARSLDQDHPEA